MLGRRSRSDGWAADSDNDVEDIQGLAETLGKKMLWQNVDIRGPPVGLT